MISMLNGSPMTAAGSPVVVPIITAILAGGLLYSHLAPHRNSIRPGSQMTVSLTWVRNSAHGRNEIDEDPACGVPNLFGTR